MTFEIRSLPHKDILAHVVDKKPDNYFDEEVEIYFDGVLPGGDVTKSYVDTVGQNALNEAKAYTDTEIAKVSGGKLYSSYGQNTDGAVTQKFFTDSVNSATDDVNRVKSDVLANTRSITGLQTDKQDKLVSGTNIKTINGQPIVGSGDVEITAEPETLSVTEFNNIWENA